MIVLAVFFLAVREKSAFGLVVLNSAHVVGYNRSINFWGFWMDFDFFDIRSFAFLVFKLRFCTIFNRLRLLWNTTLVFIFLNWRQLVLLLRKVFSFWLLWLIIAALLSLITLLYFGMFLTLRSANDMIFLIIGSLRKRNISGLRELRTASSWFTLFWIGIWIFF